MRLIYALLLSAWSLHAATYYVTIAGLGGTPEYETQFQKWASDLDAKLRQNGPEAHIETISGAAATRQHIQDVFARLATETKPEDAVAVFLIGHGTFDGVDYKFNIPGPDMTSADLAAVLNRVPAGRQLVVNMTSCSGASLAKLARKERIVITATKSGNEKNATVFARYWVDAFQDPAADTDKNGTISALEAFRYAQQKTTGYFETEKLLATEHAQFTDTGSSNAVRDPKPENGQGLVASAFPLLRPPTESVATAANPEKQKLLGRKQHLEAEIDQLKYRKASLPEDEYKKEMAGLLLQLARTQAEIDQ